MNDDGSREGGRLDQGCLVVTPLEIFQRDRAAIVADMDVVESTIELLSDPSVHTRTPSWIQVPLKKATDLEIILTGDCEACTALAEVMIARPGIDPALRSWLICEYLGEQHCDFSKRDPTDQRVEGAEGQVHIGVDYDNVRAFVISGQGLADGPAYFSAAQLREIAKAATEIANWLDATAGRQ